MANYILVVDDSVTIRASVEYVLKQAGYSVVVAVDGVDGLEKLESSAQSGHAASMIITDVNMPRMDGISFTRQVKTGKFQRTPVLILKFTRLT